MGRFVETGFIIQARDTSASAAFTRLSRTAKRALGGIGRSSGNLKNKIRSSVNSMKSSFTQLSEKITAINQGFQLVSGVVSGVRQIFGGLISKVQEVIALANTQEEAERRLSGALRIRGKFTQETIDGINGLNRALQQQLGIGDEVLLNTQATLIALGVMPDRLEAATKATIGLTAIMGSGTSGLAGSARLVARALDGDVTLLTRYVGKVESSEEALEKLNQLFLLAEAQSGSYATQVKILDANLGDLGETFGGMITKSESAAENISFASRVVLGFDESIKGAQGAVGGFTEAVAKSAPVLATFGEVIVSAHNDMLLQITNFRGLAFALRFFADEGDKAVETAKKLAAQAKEELLGDVGPEATKGILDRAKKLEKEKTRAAKKATKDAEKARAQAIKDRITQFEQEADIQRQQAEADQRAAQERLDNEKRIADEMVRLKQEAADSDIAINAERIRESQIAEREDIATKEGIRQEAIARSEKATMDLDARAASAGSSLASSVGGAFLDLVSKARTFEEVALGALASIGKAALDLALSSAFKLLFRFILGSTTGGIGTVIGGLFGFNKGGLVGMAHGGLVGGGGPQNKDSQLIAATPGERVMTVHETRAVDRGEAVFGRPDAVAAVAGPAAPNVTQNFNLFTIPTRVQMDRMNRDSIQPSNRNLRRLGFDA